MLPTTHPLVYQLQFLQIELGLFLNTAAVARATVATLSRQQPATPFLSQPVDTRLQTDLEQLERFAAEAQMIMADLEIILSGAPQKDHLKIDYLTKTINNFSAANQRLSQQLPPIQAPLLPRGNQLSVLAYKIHLLCQQAEELYRSAKEKIEPPWRESVEELLKQLTQFFLNLARWLNLLLDRREFTWQPPQESKQAASFTPNLQTPPQTQPPSPTSTPPTPPTPPTNENKSDIKQTKE